MYIELGALVGQGSLEWPSPCSLPKIQTCKYSCAAAYVSPLLAPLLSASLLSMLCRLSGMFVFDCYTEQSQVTAVVNLAKLARHLHTNGSILLH